MLRLACKSVHTAGPGVSKSLAVTPITALHRRTGLDSRR